MGTKIEKLDLASAASSLGLGASDNPGNPRAGGDSASGHTHEHLFQDTFNALRNLGYREQQVEMALKKAFNKLDSDQQEPILEFLVKESLKEITAR